MLLAGEEFWHNADHVNVAVKAIGLEAVAAEYLEPIFGGQLLLAVFCEPLVNNTL